MNIAQIENSLQLIIQAFNPQTFIYDLLLAYGQPKATITRLQKGGLNLSKLPGEIAWKKKLFFKEVQSEDLHALMEGVEKSDRATKHDPRFLIVTDYTTLVAVDTKTGDRLDIPVLEIARHFDFFLPLAGMEKKQAIGENPADVKAAEKMAKLYDQIRKENPVRTPQEVHNLNVFLSRLLFCFFAEDTEIFAKNLFTNSVASHTNEDGSNMQKYLDDVFEVMNIDKPDRDKSIPAYLDAFPYVNGGLFRNPHQAPLFSRKSRQLLLECGGLQWKDIHPDIFGSMIQAVVTPEHRGGFGMHYTSVPNIMKVIEPLFLDELKDEFEAVKHEPRGLSKLLERLSRIKIFDPACGSGNFLIIAYKELRLLEIKILQQLQLLQQVATTGFEPKQLELIPKAQLTLAAAYRPTLFSRVELSQFYGIELDDFAHEIAILSLWLAKHQMNMTFKEVFGSANPTLPLAAGGNIVHGNATRLNWGDVCPKSENDEIYILGNPPYLGARMQDASHKEDMDIVFTNFGNYRDLDYIACWFYKGARYIQNADAKLAFVSTNSISQGLQLNLLWPSIFSLGLEINFAVNSFKWQNNAKKNAAVIVVIIGLANQNTELKTIYADGLQKKVKSISAYLGVGSNVLVERRSKPLSFKQEMSFGNMPNDGGGLILSAQEKESLLNSYPDSKKYVRSLFGAAEFIKGEERYCLWIKNAELEEAIKIPFIKERIEISRKHRLASRDKGTRELAKRPHQFRDLKEAYKHQIIIPRVSSERREYIPTGFLSKDVIISDSAQVIYDADAFLMGIITSRMHMVWMRQVGGKLKSDYRYAKDIVYNTFPLPHINESQKREIERNVFNVLAQREVHSEKTLAHLYDPDKMPEELRQAHKELDLAVERCYRSRLFESDEERLEYLFKLYEQFISEEKQRNGVMSFEQPQPKKKKSK